MANVPPLPPQASVPVPRKPTHPAPLVAEGLRPNVTVYRCDDILCYAVTSATGYW